jgi:hypothetical protein
MDAILRVQVPSRVWLTTIGEANGTRVRVTASRWTPLEPITPARNHVGMSSGNTAQQLARAVFMVRPAAFAANLETAATNTFQVSRDSGLETARRAREEFDSVVAALRHSGVDVHVGEDSLHPVKPDACFPNNWVSFHSDGTIVLYPMMAASRRPERRLTLLEDLARRGHFIVRRTLDLTHWEQRGRFLEGTGSLTLDREQRVAYACLSPRTMLDPLSDFAEQMGYELVLYDAVDRGGVPIYHTNVMLSIGKGIAFLCPQAIPSSQQRASVVGRLRASGRAVLAIDQQQMANFCGNVLMLEAGDGEPLIAMSERAYRGFREDQIEMLNRSARLIVADIGTIESCGGGGIRCMLAEIFLPRT